VLLSHKAWAVATRGRPRYRVPIDPGWACPHRKRDRVGGCTFCPADGGRARQISGCGEAAEQAVRGIRFVRERYGEGDLELYIQAYTATHASVAALRQLVEPLLDAHPFVSLSLGTRPDCLPTDTLTLLCEWNRRLEVWVELGVQSAQDRTLSRIRRGHRWEDSRRALHLLHAQGLRACAHLIFGLPGEDSDDMFASLAAVTACPLDALKFHNLHILRDAPLGREWIQHPFPVLSEPHWLELLQQLLRRTPADLPLFRVFTDSPPERRLAPESVYAKGRFLRLLRTQMQSRGWAQGELCASITSSLSSASASAAVQETTPKRPAVSASRTSPGDSRSNSCSSRSSAI
jgi:radical SAM protein (TIGR01212 family)